MKIAIRDRTMSQDVLNKTYILYENTHTHAQTHIYTSYVNFRK